MEASSERINLTKIASEARDLVESMTQELEGQRREGSDDELRWPARFISVGEKTAPPRWGTRFAAAGPKAAPSRP